MVFSQLLIGNGRLLRSMVVGSEDILQQPLIAGSGGEHTTHQMPAAVGVSKVVNGVVLQRRGLLRRNKDRTGGAEADITAAFAHNTVTHSSSFTADVPKSTPI